MLGSGSLAGLVLIAPAVDMTRRLMWDKMDAAARQELKTAGVFHVPSDYSDEPYPIMRGLIEDGDAHLFGDRLIETGAPVHILQGTEDTDVPWTHATELVTRFASDDVVLTLVKGGDHRLSRPEDIARLEAAIDGLIAETKSLAAPRSVAPQRAKSLAIGREAKRNAEFPLDQGVGDALVVAIEGARHGRQVGLGEGHLRRRVDPHQGRGIGDHILRRRRLVVGDVEDAGGVPCDRRLERLHDVVDMDAVEDLARLDDAVRPARRPD